MFARFTKVKRLITPFLVLAMMTCQLGGCSAFNLSELADAFSATNAVELVATEIVPCRYNEVLDFSEGMAAVQLDGKWGFIDKTGSEVVPYTYDEVDSFFEGLARVKSDGKWGYIDKNGTEAIPCRYDRVGNFSDGMAYVGIASEKDSRGYDIYKYGFVDKTGKEVVPCKYDGVHYVGEGRAFVSLNLKYGLIDKAGNELPFEYDGISIYNPGFYDGLALVKKDIWESGVYCGQKMGFCDINGREVIPCKYDSAGNFSEGFALVGVDTGAEDENGSVLKYSFIDTTGKEIVPYIYDAYAHSFSEGLAAVQLNLNEWGYIDKTGKEIIPCKYDRVYDFSEGLAAVYDGDKWGFVDTTGKEVIPCKYDNVNETRIVNKRTHQVLSVRQAGFSEGLAQVEVGGKYGYIDKTGLEVIPCIYRSAENFAEGFAKVGIDTVPEGWKYVTSTQYGFVDTTGREVVPYKYEEAHNFSEGCAVVKLDGMYGVIAITAVPK